MLYTIVIMVVIALATVRGFRRGLARQTPSIIGTAFGIISCRLLAPGLREVLYEALPSSHGGPAEIYVYDTLAYTIVFFAIFAIFATITGFLSKVLRSHNRTILDNIGGSLFALFKYLLILSIAYNMLVALNPASTLLRSAKSDDGNTVFEVMLLAPAVLGGEDIEDLALHIQLEEAKKIS